MLLQAFGAAAVYHHAVGNSTAFVLAGGKSSRMGRDKAFLQWEGGTLLERAMNLAGCAVSDVWLVGDPEKLLAYGRVVADVYPGQGPLGGIHAALSKSQTELNLVLAVDMPFVEPEFLQYLTATATQTAAVVTLPQTGDGWQPLCAVYRREFAEIAERALRKGKNKIDVLFPGLDVRAIGERELADAGFDPAMFRNLNTREEFNRAEGEARRKKLP